MEYNLGDDLCRASLYFDLSRRHTYAEGGVYPIGQERAGDVLWAVGRSVKPGQSEPRKNNQAALYSCRDKTNDMQLVPCPSVFHPIVDTPAGTEAVLIVGGSDTVGRDTSQLRASVTQPYDVYHQQFSKADRVVTNSYHTAYWSLLSGRRVKLIGYSSKFASLLQLFDEDPSQYVAYDKGSYAGFVDAVAKCRDMRWLMPQPHRKQEFRQMNQMFFEQVQRL